MIEDVLKNKPGGERIINEYARTKSLTDSRRRDMVKILVAQITSEHGYAEILFNSQLFCMHHPCLVC